MSWLNVKIKSIIKPLYSNKIMKASMQQMMQQPNPKCTELKSSYKNTNSSTCVYCAVNKIT